MSYFFCQDAKQNRQIITAALINQFQQAILHHRINRKKSLFQCVTQKMSFYSACPRWLQYEGSACCSLVFSLPYMPPWRGISCPGLEVATCWSTSHTCQCNGYDHWGRQGAMKMGMRRREGEEEGKEREGEGWCWRWRRNWITVEESGSAFPRDGEGKEHRRGGGVKGKREAQEWRRYKRKGYSKASRRRRE